MEGNGDDEGHGDDEGRCGVFSVVHVIALVLTPLPTNHTCTPPPHPPTSGLITTERNFVALWEKGVPGRLSPWDLKVACEEYALTIASTDGGNEPGVAADSKLANMPRSLQKVCGCGRVGGGGGMW